MRTYKITIKVTDKYQYIPLEIEDMEHHIKNAIKDMGFILVDMSIEKEPKDVRG